MIFSSRRFSWLYFSLIFMACNNESSRQQQPVDGTATKGSYAYDVEFLKKHSSGVVE